jgi:glucan phosphoethanolaminetransferase (alkaline phosphatase superfamily)
MNKKEVTLKDLKIFGLIWGTIFAFIAYKSDELFTFFASLSAVFFLSALIYPKIYLHTKFYPLWIKFGDFLGKVNGFLISFILFYGIFAPIGIILKLMRKDLLSKNLNPSASSYFIDRKAQPGDMKNQF